MFGGISDAIGGAVTGGLSTQSDWLFGGEQGGFAGQIQNMLTGGANADLEAVRIANATNIEEARKNRNWQDKMSSSAFQRQVIDLEKAGLNKMLAFGAGGASTGSGAQATVAPEPAGKAYRGATEQASKMLGLSNMSSSTQLNRANASKADADTTLSKDMSLKTRKEADYVESNTEFNKINTNKAMHSARAAKHEANIKKMDEEVARAAFPTRKKLGTVNEYVKTFGNIVNIISKVANSVSMFKFAKNKALSPQVQVLDTSDWKSSYSGKPDGWHPPRKIK